MSNSSFQILKFQSVSKEFGPKKILDRVTFVLNRGERLALIGENGSGKTTLVKIALGRETPDEGTVALTKDCTVGYLPQDEEVNASLSGGERKRIALTEVLRLQPEFLILDEPTNHLDHSGLDWLEEQLQSYPGAVILISHDRAFLNRIANGIMELSSATHQLKYYAGNYDDYMQMKHKEQAKALKAYEDQQAECKDLKRLIREKTFNARKPNAPKDKNIMAYDHRGEKFANSQRKGLDRAKNRLEALESTALSHPIPKGYTGIAFHPNPLEGAFAFDLNEVTLTIGERILLKQFSATIKPGERVLLTGANGAGKSTLLKLLASRRQPSAGKISYGAKIEIGYLPQETLYTCRDRVVDYLQKRFRLAEAEVRSRLKRIGLLEDRYVGEKVVNLSLGQQRRLQLLELMLSGANVLLLDEPTNHLAPDVIDQLEEALKRFPGAVIAATHDRRFRERLCAAEWIF